MSTTTRQSPTDKHTDKGIKLRVALERLGWCIVLILVGIAITSVINRVFFIFESLRVQVMDPAEVFNPFDIRYYEHWLVTLLHIVPSLLIVIIGPLQFVRMIRKRYPVWHRLSGRVYIFCGVISAVSGLFFGVLHPFMGNTGLGFNQAVATLFFGIYTLFCLYKAYSSIRIGNVGLHREWMIRTWAIMLGIATERLLLGFFLSTSSIDISVLFGTTFWMAAVINISASEAWINLTRTPGSGARHWKDIDSNHTKREQ
ncbi:DUF2306 domain-containing protein [Pseudomonadales bacterium]|nr:DUF2306 domain-containing protein [Pseudomonadales bacterium]